jgi:hypothetical protein
VQKQRFDKVWDNLEAVINKMPRTRELLKKLQIWLVMMKCVLGCMRFLRHLKKLLGVGETFIGMNLVTWLIGLIGVVVGFTL